MTAEYWLAIVDEVERELAGHRYARLLGLPTSLAPVAAAMVLSSSQEIRKRAAAVIIRALQRAARRAA